MPALESGERMSPASKPLSPWWRFACIAAGVFAFLLINVLLFLDGCTGTEFMFNCTPRPRQHAFPVLVMILLLAVAAAVSRRGRAFAIGFATTLLAVSVLSLGGCTRAWTAPLVAVKWEVQRRVRPYQEERARKEKEAAQLRAWLAALNARPLDVARGVELASAVAHCARRYALDHEGRFAVMESDLLPRCEVFRFTRVGSDVQWYERYVIPVPAGQLDQFGMTVEPVRGDAGWRASYEVLPGGFAVRVVPDEQLSHDWPRVLVDAAGTAEVQAAENAPPLSISPVADLRTMVECLKGIPAAVERRKAETGGISYGWFLTSMARKVCPGLSPRLNPLMPNDENATRLDVLLPVGPGGVAVPVASYDVRFEIRQPANKPFAYDIIATPRAWGLRRYLATFEGAIHYTTETRPPTTADPLDEH